MAGGAQRSIEMDFCFSYTSRSRQSFRLWKAIGGLQPSVRVYLALVPPFFLVSPISRSSAS
jgi:hypothetical protein